PLGDPVERLKQHMIREGWWSDERHDKLVNELRDYITECWEEACSYGTMTEGPFLDKNELFEDVFKDMPPHLIRQRDELRALEEN
ncbi:MAG TPA: thiamine pyrophosphate-dependent enzyme, partial [Pseudomonadales bacterium]